MNRSTIISVLLILLGGGFLIFRASTGRMGQSYARVSQVNAEEALQKQLEFYRQKHCISQEKTF